MAERRSEGWVAVMPSATGYYLHYLLSTDRTTHTVLANECYMLGVQDLGGLWPARKLPVQCEPFNQLYGKCTSCDWKQMVLTQVFYRCWYVSLWYQCASTVIGAAPQQI